MVGDALLYLSAFLRHGLRGLLRPTTLADLVERQVRRRPGSLALDVAGQRLDYRQLSAAGAAAAGCLHALGARSGDVVALLGRNSIGYVAALLGGARSGVTLALVHPELSGEPLRDAVRASGARFMLCEEDLAPAASAAEPDLPFATFDPESCDPFAFAGACPGFAADRHERDFALVYTSGTTGLPKACRVPHSRVLSAACLFGAPLFDFRSTDRLLCALPLHHGSPLMLGLGTCLLTGTPLILERRFSATELVARAKRSGATVLLYVGDLGRLLLATSASPQDREHRLRLAVGNGMAPEIWPRFQARFGIPSVREFYAATESPVGILNLSGRVGSVGNLPYAWMFGLKLARLDAEGELAKDAHGRLIECGVGEPGELLVRARRRGIGVYHGYVDPSASEARLLRSAFAPGAAMFRTFDVLRRDRDGFYYFVERRGDSYRFKGENVSVAQVERELRAIPGVVEALVTGVEIGSYDGRAGLALVVGDSGFEITRLEALRERLPKSALPRFVRLVSSLARTSSLKLRRRAWADEGVDPERVHGPLWVLAEGKYQRLLPSTYRDVLSGRLRL